MQPKDTSARVDVNSLFSDDSLSRDSNPVVIHPSGNNSTTRPYNLVRIAWPFGFTIGAFAFPAIASLIGRSIPSVEGLGHASSGLTVDSRVFLHVIDLVLYVLDRSRKHFPQSGSPSPFFRGKRNLTEGLVGERSRCKISSSGCTPTGTSTTSPVVGSSSCTVSPDVLLTVCTCVMSACVTMSRRRTHSLLSEHLALAYNRWQVCRFRSAFVAKFCLRDWRSRSVHSPGNWLEAIDAW